MSLSGHISGLEITYIKWFAQLYRWVERLQPAACDSCFAKYDLLAIMYI